MHILNLSLYLDILQRFRKVLTVNGVFTDEPDAVSAVEIVPVSIVDEARAVLAFFMAMGPVVGLAGFPVPKRAAASTGLVASG